MSTWQDSFQPNVSAGDWQSSFQPNGYIQNVSNDWNAAKNKIGQLWADQQTKPANEQLNPVSTGVQMLGAASNGAFAPITEATKDVYNSLPNGITQPLNNTASNVGQGIKNAYAAGVDKLASTDSGKAIGDYLANSPHIQNGMQEVSDDAIALASTMVVSPIKTALGKASESAGDTIYDSGKAAQDAAHQKYVQDLILPKKTPTVQADMALRTSQVNGKNIYNPTTAEAQTATTVAQIPGLSKSNSMQANLAIIRDANRAEADALKEKLQASNVSIPDDTIQGALETIRNTLPKATNVTAPGDSTIARVVNAGLDHITSQPQTAAGMLEARKAFDAQIIREKGEGILDPAVESPRSNAVAAVRQAMNKMVSDAVPSADVLQSLKKQNQLFTAMDNIAPKAGSEAPTRLGRMMQKASPHGFSDAAGKIGAIGLADIASHYIHIPPEALAVALGGAGLYKGATHPMARVMLGKAMGGGQ